MTGFGRSIAELPSLKVTVEIRTLNSKMLDLNLRMANRYRDKEPEVRAMASRLLGRGKVDLTVGVEVVAGESIYHLNTELAKKYFEELSRLAAETGLPLGPEVLPALLRLPEVVVTVRDESGEEEWMLVRQAIEQALSEVEGFRTREGRQTEELLRQYHANILALLGEVPAFEGARIERIRDRIQRELLDLGASARVDENRFEQELLYYIEKLDISEEKARLEKHCLHFTDTLDSPDSEGKKLGFIAQEMGREINTIGSKANDASIQRLVVGMKDELEKIKEQLANIL